MFRVLKHRYKEHTGELREVVSVDKDKFAFFTVETSTGKPLPLYEQEVHFIPWYSASFWEFRNNTATLYRDSKSHTEYNFLISFVLCGNTRKADPKRSQCH